MLASHAHNAINSVDTGHSVHWTKTILFISIRMNSTFLLCNRWPRIYSVLYYFLFAGEIRAEHFSALFTIPDPELAQEQDEKKTLYKWYALTNRVVEFISPEN